MSKHYCIAAAFDTDFSLIENKFKELGIKYSIRKEETKSGSHSSSIGFASTPSVLIWGEYIYQNYENDKIGLSRKREKYNIIKEQSLKNRFKRIRILLESIINKNRANGLMLSI